MSDYHILSGDTSGNRFAVVMHIPLPDTDNAIGYNYRTALSEMRGTPFESAIPYDLGAEQTALDNGELIEHSFGYNSNPALTPVENRNILRQIWTELQQDGGFRQEAEPNLVAEMQNTLKYWHYQDNVP